MDDSHSRYFKDTNEMYAIHAALFDKIRTDPDLGPKLAASKLIIRFNVKDPAGIVTINLREPGEGADSATGPFFSYSFGESDLEPDVTFTNSADLSNEFWQGHVNVMTALATGKIKREGSIRKALKLLPLLKPIFRVYPKMLYDMGRHDLIVKK